MYLLYVTGPAKRDQVGTKYIISHNGKYLDVCVYYLVSVNCKIFPITLYMDDKNFILIATGNSYDATKSKNVVKFCVPTWYIFAGLVTYMVVWMGEFIL